MTDHLLHIPDALFKKIERNAKPFVEHTPVAVLQRWADYFDSPEETTVPAASNPSSAASLESSIEGLKRFNPLQPPDLFHTRAKGTFGGESFKNWNHLVRIAHVKAFSKARSFDELKRVTHAQIRRGKFSDNGFKHLPEIDISIQGVDANHAWKHALRLAKYLETEVHATIEWRESEGAAYPGVAGVLEWGPS